VSGTLASTVVLAIEVLVSIVTGVVRYVFVAFGRAGDALLRSTGTFLGQVFRLSVFVLFMALVGAAITLVAAFLLTGARF
jgi:hypothetical protein